MREKIIRFYELFLDDIPYNAASLSFFTIFSLLPLLALLVYVVSHIPEFHTHIEVLMIYIMDFINPTHSQTIASSISGFLTNTDKLGTMGIFYLLFVFAMFFKDYEHIVNQMFGTKPRALYKLFFMYIGFLILIPALFVAFVFVSTVAKFSFSVQIFAFLFIWIIFIVLFLISANTTITLRAASFSSLVTIILLSVVKQLFGYYVSVNTTYATIYGSFSIALFFFFWIYISWNIYLFGIKLCYLINQQTLGIKNETK